MIELSKSGVNHRLRRIKKIAQNLTWNYLKRWYNVFGS
jgi:DNA-binding transcriptional regulator WhiA